MSDGIIKVMITIAVLCALIIENCAMRGCATFDGNVEDCITDRVRLAEGTEQFERWKFSPNTQSIKVYIFNVTNVEGIMNGEKPIVQEVGPYVYKQYRKKMNVAYNESTDTLSYEEYLLFEFDTVATFPLTEDDELTVLNVALQGAFQSAERSSVTTTLNALYRIAFPDTDTPFHRVSVKTYLFEGYKFCDPAKLVGAQYVLVRVYCNSHRAEATGSKMLTVDDDDVISFSFFNHRNYEHDGTFVINAGNKDVHQLGAIQSWNGLQKLSTWDDGDNKNSKCNSIRGRDSTIYPPFNNDSSKFDIYNTEICRILQLETTSSATFKGINGNVATLSTDNFSNKDERSCYCTLQTKRLDGSTECLPEGFSDMDSCFGQHLVISLPHLLGADDTYRSTVHGLTPDENKHNTFFNIEPRTGTPLKSAMRLQFNMFIRPIMNIEATYNFDPAVMPILWIEEEIELADDLVQQWKDDCDGIF